MIFAFLRRGYFNFAVDVLVLASLSRVGFRGRKKRRNIKKLPILIFSIHLKLYETQPAPREISCMDRPRQRYAGEFSFPSVNAV